MSCYISTVILNKKNLNLNLNLKTQMNFKRYLSTLLKKKMDKILKEQLKNVDLYQGAILIQAYLTIPHSCYYSIISSSCPFKDFGFLQKPRVFVLFLHTVTKIS